MARLYKTSTTGAELLLNKLNIADTFFKRGWGLLGHKTLATDEGLWINVGNNAHTFFMRFSIDCIFLDSKMEIKKILSAVRPFRFVGPYWKATSFIETAAGFAETKNLKVGDHLYVVN
ncbi:MAG: DUF192 domain-containing protein [Bdellovibrionaceae bacterium]|nr:DUF192 domain-containing protein [Bdellovibrio sp.]